MRTEFTKQQLNELKTALKDKKNARHHRKLQTIILYAEGMSLVKSAEATGFVHQTVRNLSNRYLTKGLSASAYENRKNNPTIDVLIDIADNSSIYLKPFSN